MKNEKLYPCLRIREILEHSGHSVESGKSSFAEDGSQEFVIGERGANEHWKITRDGKIVEEGDRIDIYAKCVSASVASGAEMSKERAAQELAELDKVKASGGDVAGHFASQLAKFKAEKQSVRSVDMEFSEVDEKIVFSGSSDGGSVENEPMEPSLVDDAIEFQAGGNKLSSSQLESDDVCSEMETGDASVSCQSSRRESAKAVKKRPSISAPPAAESLQKDDEIEVDVVADTSDNSSEDKLVSDNHAEGEPLAQVFPVGVLSGFILKYVMAVAAWLKIPVGYVAATVLATVSIVLGKKAFVSDASGLKTYGNLNIILGLATGEGKSLLFGKVMEPLRELQRQFDQQWDADQKYWVESQKDLQSNWLSLKRSL